jgi:hypothetical protein
MGIFRKLFSKAPVGTRLEQYVDSITPRSMTEKVKTLSDDIKVPYAQAMTVMLFARVFTKGLQATSRDLSEPFKTTWTYPHDRIFAEVVGFYYFVLMKDYQNKADGDDWLDDDDEGEHEDDPYLTVLRQSLYFCSKLIHATADFDKVEMFVANRAITYLAVHRRKQGVVDVLITSILSVWNPDKSGRPNLDISSPTIPVMAAVTRMPTDEVVAACRELYDTKAANPKAF